MKSFRLTNFSVFLIIIIFLLNNVLAQECIDPTTISKISDSINLCSGEYNLSEGLTIEENNIIITCENTSFNLPGDKNGFAFYAENKNNIEITGCTIQNFQTGIEIIYSDNMNINKCIFKENIIGIKVENSNENNITSNTFIDNDAYDIFLNQENKFNIFKENEFTKGFNINSVEDNVDNSYIDNSYTNSDATGPRENHNYDPANNPNLNKETTPESTGKETIILDSNQYNLDENGNVIDAEYIIRKAYELEENDDIESMNIDIENAKIIRDSLKIDKSLIVDYDERTTQVISNITVVKDVQKLEIYEFIPKCLVSNVDEMILMEGEYRVIEEDPLIVWEHGDVKTGDQFVHSYKINKVFNRTPTTLAISDIEVNLAIDECACGTSENPTDIPIGGCDECAKKKKFNIFIPLFLIPIIGFIVIYFSRFEQKN